VNTLKRLEWFLKTLLIMILGLMALGAGVRAMNAGLSCPDWPLCFGKVIPDFHPAVWFEFVHRAYAGVVALLFMGTCGYVLWSPIVPRAAKRAASAGVVFLLMQIAAGGLTVLWKVKWFTVTSHLMLATLFFCSVLWMLVGVQTGTATVVRRPAALKFFAGFFTVAVFCQILMGGIVASTYAGSVCVDWPLCDGQWVPTWQGIIGFQIIHRFIAYGLALSILVFAAVMHVYRKAEWMTPTLKYLCIAGAGVVVAQVTIGVLNLVLYIPPALTVLHQSVAVILLAIQLRLFLEVRRV
jgi:heme a synthase